MTTKEQKQLIEEVKRESGTNEFLSVSDLIVRIEQNYKKKGETLYYEDAGITFSLWNDFLRNTPLSMDLFIGEGAIFEGFANSIDPKYSEWMVLFKGEVVKKLEDYYDSYVKIKRTSKNDEYLYIEYITCNILNAGHVYTPRTLADLAGIKKIPPFILK